MLAAHFGAGRELDIYYAAFQIPDALSVVFLLGAGSAAILPIFQEYLARDREEAQRLISRIFTIFLVGALCVAAVAFVLAPWLIRVIVPGFSSEERTLTVALARIMLLSPIFLGLSSILSAVNESFRRFLAYASAPILYNIGIIVGIGVFMPLMGFIGLGAGVVLGAALHYAAQWRAVALLGFMPRLVFFETDVGMRRIVRLSFPRVLSVGLSHLTIVALTALGSTLTEGSIAIFRLAQNLYFFPVGIFGISYSIAIFPSLGAAALRRDAGEFFRELFVGIRSILFWIAPSITIFVVLRAHIVRSALGAGLFSWEDTRLTAASLGVLALAMAGGSLTSFLIKGFYALEDTWRPFFINIASSLISIGAAAGFVWWLTGVSASRTALLRFLRIEDIAHPEVLGLSFGLAVGLTVDTFLLYWALVRLGRRVFHASGGRLPARPHAIKIGVGARPIVEICFAALVAGAAAYLVRASFSETLPLITFLRVITQGFLAGLAGIAAYFATLALVKNEDITALFRSTRRRLFSVGILPKSWNGEQIG